MLLWTIRGFVFDLVRYSRTNQERSFRVNAIDLYPILHERYQDVGALRGYYFTQDLWPSRKIFARHPANHLGIGSRVDGFVAHLLTCMPVKVVDVRVLPSTVPGLTFLQDDASELARFPDASVDSISSLHASEHSGLGPYSDPVDPDACFRFMDALQRVLARGRQTQFPGAHWTATGRVQRALRICHRNNR